MARERGLCSLSTLPSQTNRHNRGPTMDDPLSSLMRCRFCTENRVGSQPVPSWHGMQHQSSSTRTSVSLPQRQHGPRRPIHPPALVGLASFGLSVAVGLEVRSRLHLTVKDTQVLNLERPALPAGHRALHSGQGGQGFVLGPSWPLWPVCGCRPSSDQKNLRALAEAFTSNLHTQFLASPPKRPSSDAGHPQPVR
jgi:hypothetical protein